VLLHALPDALLEMLIGPAGLCDTDHRVVQAAAFDHVIEGREDLAVG
jgi:hypothetical protein